MSYVVAGVPFLLTAIVAAALAALVFRHGPDKGSNRCLAAVLASTAAFAFGNAMYSFTVERPDEAVANSWYVAGGALWTLSSLAAIPLVLSWPTPRAWAPRLATRLWPYALGGVLLAFVLVADDVHGILGSSRALWSPTGAVSTLLYSILVLAWFPALLLAREARLATGPQRDGSILMALGLGLSFLYMAARDLVFLPVLLQGPPPVLAWLDIVTTPFRGALALAFAWLLWRLPAQGVARRARFLVVACVVCGAIDSLLYYAQRDFGLPFDYEVRLFLFAFWILVPIAMLAYVVLSGQVPGIDVKFRFAISKSTVAAVFIAVFFVASEVAQQFFSEKTSSTYIGIGIAGTLVFAMAPIQRAAEKLAEKAVPITPFTPVPAGPGPEAAYRRAVRLALRDRAFSAKEERELVLLAHDLGLTPAQAFAIRDDVMQEAA